MICGVQHFGITVSDMERSLKFYIDILGGKLITSGMGFKGPEIHRSLLQRDEELGSLSIPDLRSCAHELDVHFIQFPNAVIELLRYHTPDGETVPDRHASTSPAIPNSMHVCFHIKTGVDLEQFVANIEQESHALGMTQVKCNPIFRVAGTGGDFDGWNLIYVKGCDGEQLEFVQVIDKAFEVFDKAARSYGA